RRQDYHRGAVLVVVEDGDVQLLAEPLLDLEAAWGGDVLQVDPAEHRRDGPHDPDDLVHVLGGQAEREGVDAGEFLEQEGLPLHHRHRPLRPDVAQAEDGGAIRHHRHRVLLYRQRVRLLGVVVDRHAHPGDAGRVRHRQVVARLDRHLAPDLDLAAEVHEEGPVRDVDHPDPGDLADGVDDRLAVPVVAGVERNVPDADLAARLDQVDRADVGARAADGGGDLPEHAGPISDLEPDRHAVAGAGGGDHASGPPMPPGGGGWVRSRPAWCPLFYR